MEHRRYGLAKIAYLSTALKVGGAALGLGQVAGASTLKAFSGVPKKISKFTPKAGLSKLSPIKAKPLPKAKINMGRPSIVN